MALNLSYIINRILKVDNLGTKQRVASRTGNLSANTEEVVLDIKGPVVIDYAEFVTSSRDNGRFGIRQYRGKEILDPLTMLTYAGTTTGFSPDLVNRDGSSIVRLDVFDTLNDRYKMSINNVSFPEGCQISVINNDPNLDFTCAVLIRYREM